MQELTRFHWNYIAGGPQCCSVEPYDNEYSFSSYQFWIPNADGTLRPDWSTKEYLRFHASQDRILGVDNTGVIAFDSAGLLPKGYRTKNYPWCFLPDGGLLWQENVDFGNSVTFTRCAFDGSEMWRKTVKDPGYQFFACENSEIIFTSGSAGTNWLERIDGLTGAIIEKMPKPFGLNAWSKAYHNGYWWIAHDGQFGKDGKRECRRNTLTKLDGTLRPLAELPLPIYTQELFFSPDNMRVYIFFYKNQVMAVNAETLTIENVLIDKSVLIPRGFDSAGRFWLQRDHSTVEAWDALLSRPLSRHRLKGEIMGYHQNEQGAMCVLAWRKKDKVLRVYKLS